MPSRHAWRRQCNGRAVGPGRARDAAGSASRARLSASAATCGHDEGVDHPVFLERVRGDLGRPPPGRDGQPTSPASGRGRRRVPPPRAHPRRDERHQQAVPAPRRYRYLVCVATVLTMSAWGARSSMGSARRCCLASASTSRARCASPTCARARSRRGRPTSPSRSRCAACSRRAASAATACRWAREIVPPSRCARAAGRARSSLAKPSAAGARSAPPGRLGRSAPRARACPAGRRRREPAFDEASAAASCPPRRAWTAVGAVLGDRARERLAVVVPRDGVSASFGSTRRSCSARCASSPASARNSACASAGSRRKLARSPAITCAPSAARISRTTPPSAGYDLEARSPYQTAFGNGDDVQPAEFTQTRLTTATSATARAGSSQRTAAKPVPRRAAAVRHRRPRWTAAARSRRREVPAPWQAFIRRVEAVGGGPRREPPKCLVYERRLRITGSL